VVSSFCEYTQGKGYTFETSGMGKNVTEETTMRNAIDDGVGKKNTILLAKSLNE